MDSEEIEEVNVKYGELEFKKTVLVDKVRIFNAIGKPFEFSFSVEEGTLIIGLENVREEEE